MCKPQKIRTRQSAYFKNIKQPPNGGLFVFYYSLLISLISLLNSKNV